MMRTHLYSQFRVSNRLAALIAALLIVTSLAGMNGTTRQDAPSAQMSFAGPVDTTEAAQEDPPALKATVHKASKISLMLFH